MAERSADVAVAAVTKSFGAHRVLHGVNLEVPAGTTTAVLGPSGCGKTTLLRILAGFEEPDSGTVHIAGQQIAGPGKSVPAHRRRVGLMPQEGALFPHRSVAGNVAFGMTAVRRSETAAAVRRLLDLVGLNGLADARPDQLSGGQQQRVALARALAARPRVLLLDEPFAALDAGLRVRVREDIIAILRETQTTGILVTHDQSEALSLADTVAVVLTGTVAQHAGPAEVYDRPASLEVARFVGDTVELPGDVRAGVAHTALGAHPVRVPASNGLAVVVLRPEQLRIGVEDGAVGVVTARRFYGSQVALHVLLAGGAKVVLQGSPETALAAGDEIHVQVSGSVLAYPLPPGGQRVPLGETGG